MAPPQVDAEYRSQIRKAHRKLRALIYTENCAPIMIRLALRHALIYDLTDRTKAGITENGHEGLDPDLRKAVDLCEKVKEKCPCITYADLYQIAGIIAVEITGGPTIDFVSGRQDTQSPEERLQLHYNYPEPSLLRRMCNYTGLDKQDIVALRGGYMRLAQSHEDRSGTEDQWETNPLIFDNMYLVDLVISLDNIESSNSLDMVDKAMLDDSEFLPYVLMYAQDEDAFFTDYATAHKKASLLGVPVMAVVASSPYSQIGFPADSGAGDLPDEAKE